MVWIIVRLSRLLQIKCYINPFGIMVALACKYNLELLRFDIEQAFAQSELDHEVFMKLPPGCKSMS
ncbi:unnamed protein product [Ectocarpus sp. CCAP 1310/34]|nr:unnamed protein product [Ectocarpus sp. CCAP 1310/34]